MFVTSRRRGPHSIKMPAPLFYYHLQLDIAATCLSVIRPVVSLWGKPSSERCQWFNTVPCSFRRWSIMWASLCFNSKRLMFALLWCDKYLNTVPVCQLWFSVFLQMFWMRKKKYLIPFICVVFSTVVHSWKNALALPVESSQSERFLPCPLGLCKICATENTHFLQLWVHFCLCLFL